MTVIGDGAVGLCAVLAARRLGAERIVLMGRHKDRTDLGREFGATNVVPERGDEGIEKVRELTAGDGTRAVCSSSHDCKKETPVTAWTSDELDKIAGADELRIAFLRRDGTLGSPRIIWVVRLGDDLYVRSVNGRDSAWFRGSQVRHEGHVQAGGVSKDVASAGPGPGLDDQIDAAYRAKYRRYSASSVGHITSPRARLATIRLVPRSAAAA